ncbi:hypothetical protein, partial [Priestia megaterium]|uniref:hypothetical protein n=1 Tax=Priestia megaterium TaxID=1404 RepID=UPI001C99C02B
INPGKTSTTKNEYYTQNLAPNTPLFSPHPLLTKFLPYHLIHNPHTKQINTYPFNQPKPFRLAFTKTPENNRYSAYTHP